MKVLLFLLATLYTSAGYAQDRWQYVGGSINPVINSKFRAKLDADSGVFSKGIRVLTELDTVGLVQNLISYIDSTTQAISQTTAHTFTVPTTGLTFYDTLLSDAVILNIDRNGFNETSYTQDGSGMLTFPDGIAAGEHLRILWATNNVLGGGSTSVDSFAYPFVYITTSTSQTLTLPTTPAFLMTVEYRGVPLLPVDYAQVGNIINLNFDAADGETFRVIYW